MGSISAPPIRRSKVSLTTDFTGSGGAIGPGFEQIPFHITDEDGLGIVGAGDGSSSLLTLTRSGLYLFEAQAFFGSNTVAVTRNEFLVRISGQNNHIERRWTSAAGQAGYVSATFTRGVAAGATIDAAALVDTDVDVSILDAYLAVTRLGPAGVTGV